MGLPYHCIVIMKRKISTILILFFCASAFAWSEGGHMISGAIAYKRIQATHPQLVPAMIKMLKANPYYDKFWKKEIAELELKGEDEEMYLFMKAGTWADDARRDKSVYPKGFNSIQNQWHYINYPLSFDDTPGEEPKPVNVLTALEKNLFEVKKKKVNAAAGEALAWVVHLVSDMHQPLHTTALFSKQFPKGDKGGNSFYVRIQPETKPISLHSYWDGLMGKNVNVKRTMERALALMAKPEYMEGALDELRQNPKPEDWAKKESFAYARTHVYRNGMLRGTLPQYQDEAMLVPEDYIAKSQPLAERRVVLAAYRTAYLLIQAFS